MSTNKLNTLKFANYKYAVERTLKKRDLFATTFERFLSFQSSRTKESTVHGLESVASLYLLPYFGDCSISDIKPMDVIAWQTWMNECYNLSGAYKNKVLVNLRSFFYYCIEIEKLISENPCAKRLKFLIDKPKEEMQIYTPDEYLKLKSAIDNFEYSVLFDILYYTGMRKGELIALQWSDFKRNSLSITKTYTRKRSKKGRKENQLSWKITTPKSKNSRREVLLPPFLVNELKQLKAQKKPLETDYIFGNRIPAGEKHLDNARDKYYKKAEVKRIRIHDFRHSHISYLIGENVDIVSIAKRIGDTVETVLKTYAHMMPNKQQLLIENLEKISPTNFTSY